MKSFPNTFIKPRDYTGNGSVLGKSANPQSSADTTGLTQYNSFVAGTDFVDIFKNGNIIKNETINNSSLVNSAEVENPYYMGTDVYASTNKYRGYFNKPIKEAVNIEAKSVGTGSAAKGSRTTEKGTSDIHSTNSNNNTTVQPTDELVVTQAIASPSLFNPYYAVRALGITENIPLLDTTGPGNSFSAEGYSVNQQYDMDINDCSIKHLVELSKRKNSVLGQARYKYSDFMYCKEVGKVSNNHMITLRKFSDPVGDNIYRISALNNDTYGHSGDIGRMVTWFGTEDNKLENILKYNYEATWRELNSKFEQQDSKETDASRGILGQVGVLTSASGVNQKYIENGVGGINIAGHEIIKGSDYTQDPSFMGRHYDNNRVYEPMDTIRSTHIYEGNLIFNHEFTLTFNYKMRAYDNINPKSAMLDLLGNILATTYKKGSFWGGEHQIIGIQPNYELWNKINEKEKSILSGTLQGTIDNTIDNLTNMLGDLGAEESDSKLKDMWESMKEMTTNTIDALKDKIDASDAFSLFKSVGQGVLNKMDSWGLSSIVNGMLKDILGRPSMYSWQSLLTGDNVGLWHVTIGNPLNPIASIGNLIVKNTEVTHTGPLGFDDFPTELKVTVTLKHARPRDMVEIGKMYTKGINSIYMPLPSSEYMNLSASGMSETKDSNDLVEDESKYASLIKTQRDDSFSSDTIGWLGDYVPSRIEGNRNLVNQKYTPNKRS